MRRRGGEDRQHHHEHELSHSWFCSEGMGRGEPRDRNTRVDGASGHERPANRNDLIVSLRDLGAICGPHAEETPAPRPPARLAVAVYEVAVRIPYVHAPRRPPDRHNDVAVVRHIEPQLAVPRLVGRGSTCARATQRGRDRVVTPTGEGTPCCVRHLSYQRSRCPYPPFRSTDPPSTRRDRPRALRPAWSSPRWFGICPVQSAARWRVPCGISPCCEAHGRNVIGPNSKGPVPQESQERVRTARNISLENRTAGVASHPTAVGGAAVSVAQRRGIALLEKRRSCPQHTRPWAECHARPAAARRPRSAGRR